MPALVLALAAHVLPTSHGAEATEQGRNLVLLPVPFYTLDTGFAGSLIGLWWERGEEARERSSFTALYSYTENDQTIFQIVPDIYVRSKRVNIKGFFAYEDWPSLYYGIGPGALESDA